MRRRVREDIGEVLVPRDERQLHRAGLRKRPHVRVLRTAQPDVADMSCHVAKSYQIHHQAPRQILVHEEPPRGGRRTHWAGAPSAIVAVSAAYTTSDATSCAA